MVIDSLLIVAAVGVAALVLALGVVVVWRAFKPSDKLPRRWR